MEEGGPPAGPAGGGPDPGPDPGPDRPPAADKFERFEGWLRENGALFTSVRTGGEAHWPAPRSPSPPPVCSKT